MPRDEYSHRNPGHYIFHSSGRPPFLHPKLLPILCYHTAGLSPAWATQSRCCAFTAPQYKKGGDHPKAETNKNVKFYHSSKATRSTSTLVRICTARGVIASHYACGGGKRTASFLGQLSTLPPTLSTSAACFSFAPPVISYGENDTCMKPHTTQHITAPHSSCNATVTVSVKTARLHMHGSRYYYCCCITGRREHQSLQLENSPTFEHSNRPSTRVFTAVPCLLSMAWYASC